VTKNIWAGGVFVATLRSFSIGERVALRLAIPGDAEPVEALAEVCWSRPFQELDDRPAGIGLRFIDTPLRVVRVMRLAG
jgi:Tfp pilus assembly protein PilZ